MSGPNRIPKLMMKRTKKVANRPGACAIRLGTEFRTSSAPCPSDSPEAIEVIAAAIRNRPPSTMMRRYRRRQNHSRRRCTTSPSASSASAPYSVGDGISQWATMSTAPRNAATATIASRTERATESPSGPWKIANETGLVSSATTVAARSSRRHSRASASDSSLGRRRAELRVTSLKEGESSADGHPATPVFRPPLPAGSRPPGRAGGSRPGGSFPARLGGRGAQRAAQRDAAEEGGEPGRGDERRVEAGEGEPAAGG